MISISNRNERSCSIGLSYPRSCTVMRFIVATPRLEWACFCLVRATELPLENAFLAMGNGGFETGGRTTTVHKPWLLQVPESAVESRFGHKARN